MSVTSDVVPWEAHARWFQASLHDRNRYLYVGRLNGDARHIGMCRFDVDPEKALAEVSINLNPAMRGLSLSHRLLAAAVDVFVAERPLDLAATIKTQNAASIRCFTRCGFVLHAVDAGHRSYRLPVRSALA